MTAKTDTTIFAVAPVAGFRQASAAEVKAWAADNGFTVNQGRGRMSTEVINAFNAAHAGGRRKNKAQYVTGSTAQPEQTYAYTTAKGRSGKFSAQPKDIREWAADNGFTVGVRGRFSRDLLDAYGQALRAK